MANVVVNIARPVFELGKMAHRVKHPEGALKRVGMYLAEVSKQSFRDQADPERHMPWKRLSPATLKRRRGNRAQILVDTGRLRRSITSIITGQRSVAVGTDTVYGKYHQFGTRRMPARPFLGFDGRAGVVIQDIVRRYIVEGRT